MTISIIHCLRVNLCSRLSFTVSDVVLLFQQWNEHGFIVQRFLSTFER